MRKRLALSLSVLVIGTIALAGCGSGNEAKDAAVAVAQEAAILRTPMVAIVKQHEDLQHRLQAGNIAGAKESYQALAGAVGQVLGPISLKDPKLAQQMANANTALKALFAQKQPDRGEVAKQGALLVDGLQKAAGSLGISLTATASAQAGNVAVIKTKTIAVRAKEYRFTPAEIKVDKGTKVTIKLINQGTEKHEFELDAFGLEIRPIQPGTSAQATFVADRPGIYEFACHVDGHAEKGMVGFLIVK